MKFILTFISCSLLLSYTNVNAQNGYANNWYFGYGCAITFNNGSPPVAISPSSIETAEGCAAISDANGKLLFYTDGIYVWDKTHAQMPNGSGLLGDPSSTQSGVIAPDPGSPNRYYIFSVAAEAQGGLTYSVVDMTLHGGLGDITGTKNVPLITPTCEKVNAVKHSNGTDIWVLTHEWNTNAFYAYLLTASGLQAPVITNVGTITNSGDEFIGQLKSSPDGKHLAMSAELGFFEMYDFNTATGVVSNPVTDINLPNDGTYGCEFSPSGNLVYISNNSPAEVYQYNLQAGSPSAIIASRTFIASSPSTVGSLQLGPDKKVYFTEFGLSKLGVINNPDVIGTGCNLQLDAIDLGGHTCELGLPDFISTDFKISNSFAFTGLCPGQPTKFTITGATPDSAHWNFGDAASGINDTSSLLAPQHIFSGPGSYTVTLITWLNSLSDTSSQNVTINTLPVINLGTDTLLPCLGTIPLDAGAGFTAYLWQDGATTENYPVTKAGDYSVTVTDNNGCSNAAFDTIVNSSAPDVSLGNDTIIPCNGSVTLDAGTGYATYLWQDGTTAETFTASKTGSYSVTITDNSGCSNSASVNVNNGPPPFVNLGVDTLIACHSIIKLDAGAGFSFYYWQDGSAAETYSVSTAGTYSVIVTDKEGCTGGSSVMVTYASCDEVFVPSAFSPNGDGVNDRFGIVNTQFLQSGKMRIYDRWGEVIFETALISDSWDGTFQGRMCPIGVYTYVVSATDTNGQTVFLKGNLSLLR